MGLLLFGILFLPGFFEMGLLVGLRLLGELIVVVRLFIRRRGLELEVLGAVNKDSLFGDVSSRGNL